jgi:hypothetical protein
MYTLKIESVNMDFLRMVQAFIQENKLWAYEIEMGLYTTTVSVSTMSIREMKRLVDLLESEEFMRDCDS